MNHTPEALDNLDRMARVLDALPTVGDPGDQHIIRRAVRSGDLPVVKKTSRPVILRADLEAWLTS